MKRFSFLGALLLISCSTVHYVPQADPEFICAQYERCNYKKGKLQTGDQINECMRVSSEPNFLQDVSVNDCRELSPCAFTMCMMLHGTAVRVSEAIEGK